jgi:hypothetical protein
MVVQRAEDSGAFWLLVRINGSTRYIYLMSRDNHITAMALNASRFLPSPVRPGFPAFDRLAFYPTEPSGPEEPWPHIREGRGIESRQAVREERNDSPRFPDVNGAAGDVRPRPLSNRHGGFLA